MKAFPLKFSYPPLKFSSSWLLRWKAGILCSNPQRFSGTGSDDNFANTMTIYLSRALVDCSQSPIFSWDRLDVARLTVNDGHLDFQMYRGGRASGIIAVVLTLTQDRSPLHKALDLDDFTEK